MAARVFMSYSHKDEALRDQLEVQLTMLKRQGLVEVWHDRRLQAGDHLDSSIEDELNSADVILLLVSPDFLASSYCYDIEKTAALQRHRDGEARVVSVILRPCEWTQTDLVKYLVTPTDGKPVTLWPDLDSAFLDIARSIRHAIEEVGKAAPKTALDGRTEAIPQSPQPSLPRSSNLRLKKEFSKADEDRFQIDSFEFISKFFRGSLSELEARNQGIETRHRQIDANSFTAAIYKNGQKEASCTIRLGGMFSSGVTFSFGDDAHVNSCNESLSVGRDDQKLFLQPMGMQNFGGKRGEQTLTAEGAAEYLWALLIRNLQGN